MAHPANTLTPRTLYSKYLSVCQTKDDLWASASSGATSQSSDPTDTPCLWQIQHGLLNKGRSVLWSSASSGATNQYSDPTDTMLNTASFAKQRTTCGHRHPVAQQANTLSLRTLHVYGEYRRVCQQLAVSLLSASPCSRAAVLATD